MALEYLKPSTLAGARPMMSCRLGPTLFLPASTVWQALHLLNTFSPAAASPSCARARSEEHTSELQSLMRISYAVFCLKKKKHTPNHCHSWHSSMPHYS